ncbi:MAG: hypothetical protein K2N28_04655, partial [Muribaculaceae bacterium]|nr:hypothetical protein [Muribaculaceae bacterium]
SMSSMRNLLLTVLLTACTLSAAATDYRTQFNELLAAEKFNAADSVLTLWEAESPGDAEVMIAKFNLLFNTSQFTTIILGPKSEMKGEYILLNDSLGHPARGIGKYSEWDDSLYNAAINVIDSAIVQWPDRLDMRWGKAKAESMREHWTEVADIVHAVLDRSAETNYAWTWTDRVSLGDSVTVAVHDGAYDYMRMTLETQSDENLSIADSLARHIIELYPNDCFTLNVIGGICVYRQDFEGALHYFTRADETCPGDGLIATNIAYNYLMSGNEEKALELYTSIADNPIYDNDTHEIARRMIAYINKDFEELKPYTYFFNYLPGIAGITTVETGAEVLSTPETLNSVYPTYNEFKSPFADSDITVTPVTVGDSTIYVWKFPEPTEMPLCLYVAFVPSDGHYKIYTLERSLNNFWVIGSMNEGSHSNYGNITECPASADEFVNLLEANKLL